MYGLCPGSSQVTLRPRPGYIPKVLSTSFRSQVVTLHSFHPPPFASSEDERLHLLCPVRALKLYVDRSKVWRKSPQLLICFGAGRRGLEPTVCCWFIFGPDRQPFSLACLVYRSQSGKLRSVELPMKENVSGYSRNPCSLNRERDTAFAAKLLTLPTGFFSAEKSEEWMARSPV